LTNGAIASKLGQQTWAPEAFYPEVAKKYFPEVGQGTTVAKFRFSNSKLREKHFSTKPLIRKYQVSKPRVAMAPCNPIATPIPEI